MKTILSILTIAFLFISCATTKDLDTSASETQVPQFKNISKNDSLFASIKRGVCYGTCPSFELKIYNSGYAVLEGKRFIDLIGVYSTKLSPETMHALLDKANEINFQEMDDVYDNEMVTDLPATTTSIVINGKRKEVRRRYDFPKSIVTFEALFDDLLTSQKWKKLKSGDSEIEKR